LPIGVVPVPSKVEPNTVDLSDPPMYYYILLIVAAIRESFETLLNEAVQLAYESFPEREEYRWNGLSVFAFDGSKYTLPATQGLRYVMNLTPRVVSSMTAKDTIHRV